MEKKNTKNAIEKYFGVLRLSPERKKELIEAIRKRREEIDVESRERQKRIRARLNEIARKKRHAQSLKTFIPA